MKADQSAYAIPYARFMKTGTTGLRPELNIGASKHPLHSVYSSARLRGIVERWLIFDTFVEDVSPRPNDTARLLRIRPDEPLGPSNFKWSVTRKAKNGHWQKPANKEWFARNRRKQHETMLQHRFGIGVDEFEQMLESQDGRCAICQCEQGTRRFHVDHCHQSGAIRGLLCGQCNSGLGQFRDDPANLRSAIAILTRSQPDGR